MDSQKDQRLIKLASWKRELPIEKRILYSLRMLKISELAMMFNQREIYPDMLDGQDIYYYTDKRKSYCKELKYQQLYINSAKL